MTYLFKRGKRKTIGFVVGPDGLVVSAPRWVSLTDVETALQEKSDWIVRKLGESQQRLAQMAQARVVWADGATLMFLGDRVTLRLDPSHTFIGRGAQLCNEPEPTLLLGLPHHATPQQIRDAVQAWLMREAKRLFTVRLDHFAPQLKVQWRELSLSNAGTRWGSARSDGSIRLHWRLIHFKPSVIDYVVAHELAHLRVMNHSPQFWDTVGQVVPDYAQRRKALKSEVIAPWA